MAPIRAVAGRGAAPDPPAPRTARPRPCSPLARPRPAGPTAAVGRHGEGQGCPTGTAHIRNRSSGSGVLGGTCPRPARPVAGRRNRPARAAGIPSTAPGRPMNRPPPKRPCSAVPDLTGRGLDRVRGPSGQGRGRVLKPGRPVGEVGFWSRPAGEGSGFLALPGRREEQVFAPLQPEVEAGFRSRPAGGGSGFTDGPIVVGTVFCVSVHSVFSY